MNEDQHILTNPEHTLQEYILNAPPGQLGGPSHGLNSYEVGRLSVGLKIESTRRIFEQIGGTSLLALSKEEILSAFHTLLVNLELHELVQEWYERLWDWQQARRPIFERDGDGRISVVSAPAEPSDDAAPPASIEPLPESPRTVGPYVELPADSPEEPSPKHSG